MRLALLLSLGACSFSARAQAQRDAEIDVPQLDAADAADAPPDAPPFCDSADTTLVACYQFEGTTNDASSNHLDASMTNVTFVQGKLGMAAQVDATTQMNVAENAAENPPALTVEAWIKAPLPATGARAGIVDNEGVWGFFLHEQGELQCITGTNVAANVPADTWTHVACTYDSGTRVIYVNGVAVDTATGGGALGASGASGMTLAANSPTDDSSLMGEIDELRIFSVARTAEQICGDAGCQE